MVIHETEHKLFVSELLHEEEILFLHICNTLLSDMFQMPLTRQDCTSRNIMFKNY